MAGSVAKANVFACNLMISKVIARRGFSAVAAPSSQGAISTAAKGVAAAAPRSSVGPAKEEKVSWVPDPATGYYRPENGGEQIDVAELRAILLKKN